MSREAEAAGPTVSSVHWPSVPWAPPESGPSGPAVMGTWRFSLSPGWREPKGRPCRDRRLKRPLRKEAGRTREGSDPAHRPRGPLEGGVL